MHYRRNADVDLQQLSRNWQSGDLEAGIHYLRTKFRNGQLILPQIALGAGLLDAACLEVLKEKSPEHYHYVIRHKYQLVPGVRKQGIGPVAGNYISLSAGFSIRALIGAVDAIREMLPEEVQQLSDEARAWLKLAAGDHEEPGQEIAERYLDFFEALPQSRMRLRRDQGEHERLEQPRDQACAAAFHLTHAISMSSGCNWRTRWKWGWASDRMGDGVIAAIRACKYGDAGEECMNEVAEKIRTEVLPWLLLS
jgi:hypothetical protein